MKPDDAAHQFAAWLLRLAHRFSPPQAREWGDAMLAELGFVEGAWPALAWAAGGARVLMKQTILHSLSSGQGGEAASVPPGPFRSEVPMRKLTFGLALLSAGVFLVLLFAPSFQQALNVSMDSWLWAIDQPPLSARALNRLADQARAERDAETLAFVALQLPPGAESARMADEAVELDPKLTWIYYQVSRYSRSPQSAKWVGSLEAWDPQNAALRLLEAQLEGERISNGNFLAASPDQLSGNARWMNAMAAAFAAPKYDSYLSARLDLTRDVLARRHIGNPLLVLNGISSQPLPVIAMLQRYAYMTYDRAKGFETKGDLAQASREYWTVARFGQVMHLQAQTDIERLAGAVLLREAYQKLASVAERSGHPDERALLAYQVESLSPPRQLPHDNGFLIDVYLWNAEIGMVSMLVLLFSAILLAGWGLSVPARRFWAGTGSGRLGGFYRASGFAGALGLLVSSLTLYLSYHPYAELFGRFAKGRGAADAGSLMAFWGFAEIPWALNGMFSRDFWWLALLILAAFLLGFEILRIVASRRPARVAV